MGSRPLAGKGRHDVKKVELLEIIRKLPEDIDLEKLMYTLYVRRQIEIGLAAADAGDEISHEEFEKLSEEWLE